MLTYAFLGALVAVLVLSRNEIALTFSNLHLGDVIVGVVASIPAFIVSVVIAYRIKHSTESKIAAIPADTVQQMARESTTKASAAVARETGKAVPVGVQSRVESQVSAALSASLAAAYSPFVVLSGDNYTLAEREKNLQTSLMPGGDSRSLWLAVGEDVAKKSIYGQLRPNEAETTSLVGGDTKVNR